MSKTFFIGKALSNDTVNLTRFVGRTSADGSRHNLQLGVTRFKRSLECPEAERETYWIVPGSADIQLNRDEVILLRDQLTRFINGVSDGDIEEDFARRPRRDGSLTESAIKRMNLQEKRPCMLMLPGDDDCLYQRGRKFKTRGEAIEHWRNDTGSDPNARLVVL